MSLKFVEFWQPTNHNNIGAASVCISSARIVYKLVRVVAHSSRAVLVVIHRQCVNEGKTFT